MTTTTAAAALPRQRTADQPLAAELRSLTVATHRRHRHQLVLDNITVSVRRGGVMSVLSRHDTAASTLLDVLDGRRHPSWGSVRVAGRELTQLGHRDLSRLKHEHIARVLPSYGVHARLSVRQNLVVAQRRSGRPADLAWIDQVAGLMGMHGMLGYRAPYGADVRRARWDALVLNLTAPTIAFSGSVEVPEQAWVLVEAAPDVRLGLVVFRAAGLRPPGQGHFAEAGELALGALATEPGAGHAAHALTHAFYETGRHKERLRWLEGWLRDNRRTTFEPSHYSWHAALHELALGDESAVRRRYARELSPPSVQGVRALVDSASLLWRARLDDSWLGDVPIDEVLSVVAEQLLSNPPTLFVAMHAAVALAARGDAVGLRLLGRRAAVDSRPAYRELVVPLAAAMAALVDQRPDRAAQIPLRLMPEVERFGGSAAQREVIELTLLHALMEAGNSRSAQQLIQHALDRPSAISWLPAQRSRRASAG